MRRLQTFSDVVDWGLCIGCGACAYACKDSGARMVHVESEGFRPIFDTPRSRECIEALPICPGYQVNGDLETGRLPKTAAADHEFGPTLEIWEGWATDPDVRFRASSGGILSALSLYCLEAENFRGVVHAGMDPVQPWMNSNHVSRDRSDVLARAGSRYAPSAPCAALNDIAEQDGPYAFIGKPCDVSAVAELRRRDTGLNARIGLVLTFFCAGTPSTKGTLDLIRKLDAGPGRLTEVHYRGEGWPGRFRLAVSGQRHPTSLSYQESWSRLTGYRPLRCHLCPDGLGRLADIACGDAWDQFEDDRDPGRSLILVRTERGRAFLEGARRAGYLTLNRVDATSVQRAQTNLLARRRELFGRLAAFRILGLPIPSYVGFSLFIGWRQIGLTRQFKTVAGTIRRAVRRGWGKRKSTLSTGKAGMARV